MSLCGLGSVFHISQPHRPSAPRLYKQCRRPARLSPPVFHRPRLVAQVPGEETHRAVQLEHRDVIVPAGVGVQGLLGQAERAEQGQALLARYQLIVHCSRSTGIRIRAAASARAAIGGHVSVAPRLDPCLALYTPTTGPRQVHGGARPAISKTRTTSQKRE